MVHLNGFQLTLNFAHTFLLNLNIVWNLSLFFWEISADLLRSFCSFQFLVWWKCNLLKINRKSGNSVGKFFSYGFTCLLPFQVYYKELPPNSAYRNRLAQDILSQRRNEVGKNEHTIVIKQLKVDTLRSRTRLQVVKTFAFKSGK